MKEFYGHYFEPESIEAVSWSANNPYSDIMTYTMSVNLKSGNESTIILVTDNEDEAKMVVKEFIETMFEEGK